MWCANCQDDVATEISANGQALKCITCGEDVRQVFAPSLHPETKSARELLQKWAEEEKQRVQGESDDTNQSSTDTEKIEQETTPLEETDQDSRKDSEVISSKKSLDTNQSSAETLHQPAGSSDTTTDSEKTESAKKNHPVFRVDSAHKESHSGKTSRVDVENKLSNDSSHSETTETEIQPQILNQNPPKAETPISTNYSNHEGHVETPAPHFDVVAASKKAKSRPGRSEAIWGQLMAYAGVGILTVGTVMVLWGYFGMVEQYASTGWLLSTAGQMLLLLGIVTLISGGMQQTTHEVTERVEYLGGRMIRIEQSTEELLKGPHFAKQHSTSENASEIETQSRST